MPMVKWRVEPTAITRIGRENTLNRKASAVELTDITNCIFTNVIRQLSCMCRQSKEMFDELQQMASATVLRTNALTKRVTTLKEMASKLNPTVEEVSLDDIGAYKPFKSNPTKDPSFSHQRPKAIVDVYNSGQPVPAFSKLNQFRDDGKDCVKLYTNPDFFFELWSNQIKKEVNEKKPKRKKRQAQAQAAVTVRAPTNARLAELINKVERENAPPPIKPKPGQPPTPTTVKPPSPLDSRSAAPQSGGPPLNIRRQGSTSGRPAAPGGQRGARSSTSHRPNIAPPPPPPPLMENSASNGREAIRDSVLPPPPPSPPALNGRVESGGDMEEADSMPPPPPVLRPLAKRGTLYSVGDFDRNTAFFPLPPDPPSAMPQPPPAPATDGLAPAPPPPPPPPGPPPPVTQVAPPPTTGSILPIPGSAFQLRAVAPVQKKRESRGDLLNAIRSGITLRKVEETETSEVKQPAGGGLFDVQTILEMRRKAMEEDSDEEEDDTNWDEY